MLPFTNMSGDPEQEYFADGMVEDIITGLSRTKWLFVIARNSSFVYKGKAIDVRQVGRELGVRYVLEGGVRKSGNHVRITAQLVEADRGAHLWAERYDRPLHDIFAVQDEITLSVINAIEPSVLQAEVTRVKRKRPDSLEAYDLMLLALPQSNASMPEQAAKSLPLLRAGDCPRGRLRVWLTAMPLGAITSCLSEPEWRKRTVGLPSDMLTRRLLTVGTTRRR